MQQIEYKYGFSTVKVAYARGIIEYRGKNVTEMEITGFGVGLMSTVNQAAGGAVGGLIGHAIANKGNKNKGLSKDIDLKSLGENKFTRITQLVIAYKKPHEETVRGLNIPVNLGDPVCVDFLEKLKKDMRSKYMGVGPLALLTKELKISQKALIIGVILFILIVTGIVMFAGIRSSY